MTQFTTTLSTGPSRPGLSRALRQAVVRAVTGLVKWLTSRRDIDRLMALDDRMLRDIGLTRGDVRAAMSTADRVPPMTRLTVLAVERRAAARALVEARLARGGRKPGRTPVGADA